MHFTGSFTVKTRLKRFFLSINSITFRVIWDFSCCKGRELAHVAGDYDWMNDPGIILHKLLQHDRTRLVKFTDGNWIFIDFWFVFLMRERLFTSESFEEKSHKMRNVAKVSTSFSEVSTFEIKTKARNKILLVDSTKIPPISWIHAKRKEKKSKEIRTISEIFLERINWKHEGDAEMVNELLRTGFPASSWDVCEVSWTLFVMLSFFYGFYDFEGIFQEVVEEIEIMNWLW